MAEVDVTIEKQLLRRTHSNGIPETILEEEERIRRESLKPVNGDLLRRDPHDEGRDATKEGASDSKSLDEADDSLLRELQMRQNGDEGLGESLDRNSELSDRDSMSRNGSSNVVEMQPAGDSVVGTSLHPQTTSDGDEPPESPGLTFLDPESARRVTFM